MLLRFNPKSLPRSMTRQQWQAAYRWLRESDKRLKAEMDQRLDDMTLFGTSQPDIYERRPK